MGKKGMEKRNGKKDGGKKHGAIRIRVKKDKGKGWGKNYGRKRF